MFETTPYLGPQSPRRGPALFWGAPLPRSPEKTSGRQAAQGPAPPCGESGPPAGPWQSVRRLEERAAHAGRTSEVLALTGAIASPVQRQSYPDVALLGRCSLDCVGVEFYWYLQASTSRWILWHYPGVCVGAVYHYCWWLIVGVAYRGPALLSITRCLVVALSIASAVLRVARVVLGRLCACRACSLAHMRWAAGSRHDAPRTVEGGGTGTEHDSRE